MESLKTNTTVTKLDLSHNDINDGLHDTQPDMNGCRTFCNSQNAEFFAWHSDESAVVAYRNSCWCKTALQSENKIDQQGVISGETECDGEGKL